MECVFLQKPFIKNCLVTISDLMACWCLITYGTNISHIKGNNTLVLMHSGIVNGINCCAILILCLNNKGNCSFYLL